MPYWDQAQPPPSPFGDAFTAAGLQATPGYTPPPSQEQLNAMGLNQLMNTSTPISLMGNYPTPQTVSAPLAPPVPGQPIPVPGGGPGLPAPLAEPSLLRGPAGGAGPISRGMGIGLKLPVSSEEVAQGMGDAQKFATKIGSIARPSETLGNEGLKYMYNANAEQAAAKRAEAGIAGEGLEKLAGISGDRAKIYERAEPIEKDAADSMQKEMDETRQNMKDDTEWVRTHSRIDPYRTFRTNAGSAILGLLGVGLMATGAGLRSDTSMEWTKQVDGLLDREADQQMKMLSNKKWAVTEAGQNMKRIAQTSVDEYEARARFRMQGLQALNERAEQIKNTTESAAVRARAEQLIAENTRKLGEEISNVAMRREALRSGENVADVQARTTARGQDIGLYGQLSGHVSEYNKAMRAAERDAYKPIRTQLDELKKNFGAARAAAQRYYDALVAGKPSQQLNELASVYGDAYSKFASGGAQTAGARNALQTYGFPTSSEELFAKFRSQKSAKDMANMIKNLERSYNEQKVFIVDQTDQWPTAAPPTNSVYSSPQ